jgi:hypothetical protein
MYYNYNDGNFYVCHFKRFTCCVPADLIWFTPVSKVEWVPSPASIPTHAHKMIKCDDWIVCIPSPLPSIATTTPVEKLHELLSALNLWEQELFPELSMEVDCYEFLHLVTS